MEKNGRRLMGMTNKRGYFEIGIYCPEKECNYGTLMRSAYQLGAAGIFIIGGNYKIQSSDTTSAHRHIPARQYDSFEQFIKNRPINCQIFAIEDPKYNGRYLKSFCHPERAIYLLGPEANGLPKKVVDQCNGVISIESDRTYSYNVAMAGTLVMYDRLIKGTK